MITTPDLRRTLYLFGHLLFGLGALLFFSPVLMRASGRTFATLPLPLMDARTVVRAPDGAFYIGDAMYGRVQRYDASGGFIRGWFLPGSGGKFFALTMRGDTLSAWLHSRKVELYDSLGNPSRSYDTTAAARVELVVEAGPPGLYLDHAKVVVKDSTGRIRPLATLGDPLWFLSPFFGWMLAMVGVVIRVILRWSGRM